MDAPARPVRRRQRNGAGRRQRSGTVAAVFVKICGITHEDDALLAVALGADALGFVFAPGSSRQVSRAQVEAILHRLPPGTRTIGVFRDERPERVVEIVNTLGLGGAQLHGREPLKDVRFVRQRVPFVIHAFKAGDPGLAAAANSPADVLLVDSAEPGSGRVFDWRLAEGVPGGIRFLLAGGLTPDNVAEAVRRVRPWGADVSSGVETSLGSGRKDPRRMARFIEEARRAGSELERDGWVAAPPSGPPGERDGVPYDWQIHGQ